MKGEEQLVVSKFNAVEQQFLVPGIDTDTH